MLMPDMREGEAAGLLCAELGVAADGAPVLERIVSAGTPAIRKVVNTATHSCHSFLPLQGSGQPASVNRIGGG